MALCEELSEKSPAQQLDYERMIHYAIDLVKAHGSKLRTNLTESGEYIDVSEEYKAPFAQVSSNFRQLEDCSQTVPRLVLNTPEPRFLP